MLHIIISINFNIRTVQRENHSLLRISYDLKRINDENNIDNYDDICYSESYDDINTYNEYTEPYQELAQYYVVSEGTQKYEEIADQKKIEIVIHDIYR